MREGEEILVGMDICEDYVQLTYYDNELLSSESVSREDGEEQYLIPSRLAYRKRKKDWIIGDDLDSEHPEDIVEVKNFFQTVITGEKVRIIDKNYETEELLQKFIESALKILKTYYPFKEIEYMGITLPDITKEVSESISSALKNLGFTRERYILLNHDEAFLYYTISQDIGLWTNDTALFELEDDGLHFRILSIDRQTDPMTARISRKEKADKLTKSMINSNKAESGNLFHTLSLMALEGSVVSTIYAVGRGFIDNWGDMTLRKLSPGRRVFRGQNLYAKGACLAAKNKTQAEPDKVVFIGEDMIVVDVSIKAVKDGRDREISIVRPGVKWYEVDTWIDSIMKEEDELSIWFKDAVTKKEEQRFISFSEINGVKSGMTRIRLSIKFTDKNTCIVKASDLGFGNFVPTTNRVWELIWEK